MANPKRARRSLRDVIEEQYNSAVNSEEVRGAFERLAEAERSAVEQIDSDFRRGLFEERTPNLALMQPLMNWVNTVRPGSFDVSGGQQSIESERARVIEAARVVTNYVPIVDGHTREDYAGIDWFHGSRSPQLLMEEGFHAPYLPDFVDTDVMGTPVPEHVNVQSLSMSEVRGWQDRGYDVGTFSWIGYWREALWNWYIGLDRRGRELLARTLGWSEVPSTSKRNAEADATADFLGGHLSLIWVSENRSTAENYAHGEGTLFKIDLTKANLFGSWHDELAGGGEEVLVVPPSPEWAPQIPTSAITPLKLSKARKNPGNGGGGDIDLRLTEADAMKKMAREIAKSEGHFRALKEGRMIYTAFMYADGGFLRLHQRRDGKVSGYYHYPPSSWSAPHDFLVNVAPYRT